MDETDDNMSAEDVNLVDSPAVKVKPKKRSLVERELETSLTALVTSPATNVEASSTSRYGRARWLKTESDAMEKAKKIQPSFEKTPAKGESPVYKMYASNSPIKTEPIETPKKVITIDSLENQIENIYHENISLSRFSSDEKRTKSPTKPPKVYVRTDLIQKKEKDENVALIKNIFSPSPYKSNSHLSNILERSSEKYLNSKPHNGYLNTSSVVKTLDFDSNKKKKKDNRDNKPVLSKSDLFDVEAKCDYQIGDLAWARMGTYPYWPCIVTREPSTGIFVKKKMFGRIERDVIHVTFFGDNGRRGWIVDTMLRKFSGILEFEATRERFSPTAKKKDPRLYAAFFVSEKKMPQWNVSVTEAESLFREPKRLRIDLLNDMLANYRISKSASKSQKSSKITRTASDVSLSESLYDTLFSEDDGKSTDPDKSIAKTRKSLDVSEVVTACLDNMAAKTGITKIQRQSHMDRWLQKAKSKTPEKLQSKVTPQKNEKEVKVISSKKKKKLSSKVPTQKPYSFRKAVNESQNLKPYHNEHDYSSKSHSTPRKDSASFDISIVATIESLSGQEMEDEVVKNDDIDTMGSETKNSSAVNDKTQVSAEILPTVSVDDTVDEIQVNICSVEENAELESCLGSDLSFTAKVDVEKSTDNSKNYPCTELVSMEVDSVKYVETMDVDKQTESDNLQPNTFALNKPIAPPEKDLEEKNRPTTSGKDVKSMNVDTFNVSHCKSPQQSLDKSPSEKIRLSRHTRRTQTNDEQQQPALEASSKYVKTRTIESPQIDLEKPEIVKQDKQTQKTAVKPIVIKKNCLRRAIKGTPFGAIISKDNQTESVTQNKSLQPLLEESKNSFLSEPEKTIENTQAVKRVAGTAEADVKVPKETSYDDLDKVVKNTQAVLPDQNAESPHKPIVPVKLRLKRQSRMTKIAAEVESKNYQSEPKKTDEISIHSISGSDKLPESRHKIGSEQVDPQTIINSQNDINNLEKKEETVTESQNVQKSPNPASAIKLRLKRHNKVAGDVRSNDNKIKPGKPNEPLLLVKSTDETSISSEQLTDNKQIIKKDIQVNTNILKDENTTNSSQNAIPKPPKLRLKRKSRTIPIDDEVKINDYQNTSSLQSKLLKSEDTPIESVEMVSKKSTENMQLSSKANKAESVDPSTQIQNSPIDPDKLVNKEGVSVIDNSRKSPDKPVSNTRLRLKRHTKNPYDLWAEVEAKNKKKPLEPSGESPKENRQIKSVKQIKKVLIEKNESEQVDRMIPIEVPVSVPVVKSTEMVSEDLNMPKIIDKQITNMKRFKKPFKGDDQTEYDEQMKSLQMALEESQKELCILLESDVPIESTPVMEVIMDVDEFPTKRQTLRKKVDTNNFVKDAEVLVETQNTQEKIEIKTPNKKRFKRQSISPRVASEPQEKDKQKESKKLKKSRRSVLSDSQLEVSVLLESKKSMESTQVVKEIAEPMQIDEKPTETQIDLVTHLVKAEPILEGSVSDKPVTSKNLRSRRNLKCPKIVAIKDKKLKKCAQSKECDLETQDSLKQEEATVENKDVEKSKPDVKKEVRETRQELVEHNNEVKVAPLSNLAKDEEKSKEEIHLIEDTIIAEVAPLLNVEKEIKKSHLIKQNHVAEVAPLQNIEKVLEKETCLTEQNDIADVILLPKVEKTKVVLMPCEKKTKVIPLLKCEEEIEKTHLLEQNDVAELSPPQNVITEKEKIENLPPNVDKATKKPIHLIGENNVMNVTEFPSSHSLKETTQSEKIQNDATLCCKLIENTLNTTEVQHDAVLDEQIKDTSCNSESVLVVNDTREEDIEYGHLEFTDKHSPQKVTTDATDSVSTNEKESTTKQPNFFVQEMRTEEKEYDHLDFIFSSCTASLLEQSTNNIKENAVVQKPINASDSLAKSKSVEKLDVNNSIIDHAYILPTSKNIIMNKNFKQRELRVSVEKLPLSSLPNSLYLNINCKGTVIKDNILENIIKVNKETSIASSKKADKITKKDDEDIKMNGDTCNDVSKISLEEEFLLQHSFINADEQNLSEMDATSKLVACVNYSETSGISKRDRTYFNQEDYSAYVETEPKKVTNDEIPPQVETESLNNTINSKNVAIIGTKSLHVTTEDKVLLTVNTKSNNNIENPAIVETKLVDQAINSDVSSTALQIVTTNSEITATVDTKTQDVTTKDVPNVTKPQDNEVPTNVENELQDVTTNDKITIVDSNVVSISKDQVAINLETKLQDVPANNQDTNAYKNTDTRMNLDEFVTSVNRLPEPVKLNGFYIDECIDFSDGEFSAETSSINSEDSGEPLSVTKLKLVLKNRSKARRALSDPDFAMYLEMRQDEVMDEHPELSQPEIVEYLYKTWQYEENSKSDLVKKDDIEQSGLVKGLNDDLRQKSIRNSFRESKKRKKRNKDKKVDEDTLSVTSFNSDISDTSVKKRLRTRIAKSPALSIEDNDDNLNKEISLEIKTELIDNVSINSNVSYNSMKYYTSPFDTEFSVTSTLEDKPIPAVTLNHQMNVESSSPVEIKHNTKSKSLERDRKISPKSKDGSLKTYFKVENQNEPKVTHDGEQKTEINIKEEYDPDTASINSENSEVSLSKRKPRKERNNKTMDDPEFLKYVELRQDNLIDENPQLTHEEIVEYLYKTWLYEESVKSDIKKSDDFEQARLVKGLGNQTPQSKKVRKKVKVEKNYNVDEVIPKEKPKRKVSEHYYNEDISDIEDEIQLFEIFKPKNEIIEIDEIDEVELYFSELTQPKPNVFKGFVREKVCDICEKTGNLVKCKGCNSMFHADCVTKETEVVEVPPPPKRGRKKKIKPLPKSGKEDSESQSDEKSQDVSLELNASFEEEAPRTVNADDFEAVLAAKMQELIPTVDLTYDSYSSDEGLDWNDIAPGKCEIVDVQIKPKIVIDYANFKCNNCQVHNKPICFVCKEAVSKTGVKHRQKCQTAHCNKYYHVECLDHWPQTQFHSGEPSKTNKKANEHFESLMCPRHVCHTCVSDDPRGCRTRFLGEKLARCVRCPATYHTFTKCLPAGTQILTGSLIVCPRHYEHRPGKVPCHVNTGWCFICALGGSLICCEYCPTSFHAECLNIDPPEGGYMCEDCETGRLPLYGEMVWVKLGHYRWWPGIVLHPVEIPDNIMAVKHSPGEFVVRFFGQYDHYWVNRGRVFPFQEGDSGRISSQKSKIDADFTTAMEHAQRAFEILKTAVANDEESLDIASSLLPPHYVKLKVNKPCGSLCGRRVDIEESSLTQCECNPDEDDPCGPYTHCLNRMLLTECGPICRAGDRCSNRAFEKRLYPKMAPYRTPHRGWGLKALEDIKAGQFVIEYVGELIDEEEFRRRMGRMHEVRDENFYFLTLDKERMIDAGPKGNLARFMNHCCEPNCETQKWTVLGDVRVGLFALHDIPANSELTFNYNLECAGIEKKRCMCGARRCSGYIGAKPKQDDTQLKKSKFPTKRPYKKRKNPDGSPSTSKIKPKRPVGRPRKSQEIIKTETKPRELTEIEKDLLIIKNATNGISSDSEGSGRLSSVDSEKNPKALKRKRVSFSTEEDSSSKKAKVEEKGVEVGD